MLKRMLEKHGEGKKHDFMNLMHLCGHGLFKSSKAAVIYCSL